MKIVKNASDIRKVRDEEAVKMVKAGWKYCPKSEWKASGKSNPPPVQEEKKVKKDKKPKVKKEETEATQENK